MKPPFPRLYRLVIYTCAAGATATAGWTCVLGNWAAGAALAVYAAAMARWARRWPWTARWLFRWELGRTRHDGGRTWVAYHPAAALWQRRRPVPREPQMRWKDPSR